MEIFSDAIIDSLKILPFLFAMYLIIEIIEVKYVAGFKNSKVLKSKAAPLLGAAAGLLPQCGFSVVATELYHKRMLSIGTLAAVYIATSDEAIPILIASPQSGLKLLPLLGIKVLLAIFMGFVLDLAFRKKSEFPPKTAETNQKSSSNSSVTTSDGSAAISVEEKAKDADGEEEGLTVHGCCDHKISDRPISARKEAMKKYLLHPMVHSLKVFIYIFIVNLILGFIIEGIGEEKIADFLLRSKFLQPLLSAVVGLIPNCASSVIISKLFAADMLGIGAAISGLSVNAGIGFAVLLKDKTNLKKNLLLICIIFVASIVFGTLITLLWY